MRSTMIEKNCKACGNLINVRLADHKRGWGNFCDKSCSAAYKYGHRPRDVNKTHAKYSGWAATTIASRDVTKAKPIKEQVGKNVKVKSKLHSPATIRKCIECGDDATERYCIECGIHYSAMDDMENGWDGHKS